jgi:hypothetical protein
MVTKVANLTVENALFGPAFQEGNVNKETLKSYEETVSNTNTEHDLCSLKILTQMKKTLLLLLSLLPIGLYAQIPNAGFETWAAGNPDQWSSNNIPGIATPVSQSSDAHSGTKSVQIEVVTAFGSPYSGYISSTAGGTGLIGGDELGASVGYYDFNTQPTGGGALTITNNAPVYVQALMPVGIVGSNPVKCLIGVSITNSSTTNVGSWVRVDDVAFSNATGIGELQANGTSLSAPTPNPASGITLVPFSLERATVADIRLYDLNGRLMQTVLNSELNAGNYKAEVNAAELASGIYTLVLRTGDQVLQTKLVVR